MCVLYVCIYACGDAPINPVLKQRDTQTKRAYTHTTNTMKRNNPLESQLAPSHPIYDFWGGLVLFGECEGKLGGIYESVSSWDKTKNTHYPQRKL
jgi:hypothetical protein